VAGGAVARLVLKAALGEAFGVTAFTLRAAGVSCDTIDFAVIEQNSMRAADMNAAGLMEAKISELRGQGESAGGIVQCEVRGARAGLGEPVFAKLDAELAKAMLSIGAVKGIEFGAGFAAADMTGSEMNDEFYVDGDGQRVHTRGNNAGGILGGISTGEAIVFRVAVKPVPSLLAEQRTVALNGGEGGALTDTVVRIAGRHDACLCPRIVPVVESMACLCLADMLLRDRAYGR
jgi:chorismate synthase